ncbi:hypothetical protein D6D23_01406 [Aureobasidium pullulans]|uniref:F-box domain-containing protein n=1 Tax=Aureobasidium pullulans TaxID=5580 RepID=A0A4S8ZLN3_AURPU|nr:hypothetical protein D6D23_01406 [Aureobasidium pullulans]THW66945.1 hypothetical protein D6D20_01057 [Aureobasidium pullulans]
MSLVKCCSPAIVDKVSDPVDVPFRFRDLPKELRFMVYEYALSFDSIDKYHSDYLELLCTTANEREPPPKVNMACPSILLVSKDITEEAIPILHATPLHLSFGVFRGELENLISPTLLQNLRYVHLSDAGVHHLNPPPHDCFVGFCFVAGQLASLLRSRHSLKTLTVTYNSAYITLHLRDCLNVIDRACGIKSWTHNLVRALRQLHDINKVSLDVELTKEMRQKLVEDMQGPAQGFFALPLSVRQKIYSYAADPNESISALQRVTKELAFNIDPVYPVKETPTIFLICKQITEEAKAIVYSKPLVIKDLYPVVNNTFPNLSGFFSLGILRRVDHVELRLTDYRHLNMLYSLAAGLKRRKPNNKLKSLHLHFAEPRQKRLILAASEYYPDNTVWQYMRVMNHLRGIVDRVEITGCLPDCFISPIIYNMTSKLHHELARPLRVQNIDGHEMDVYAARKTALFRHARGDLVEF